MDIILLLVLFVLNAIILYFHAIKRYSIVVVLNIAGLCLVVALAAQLHLLENILWILLALVALALVGLVAYVYHRRRLFQKTVSNRVIEAETKEIGHEEIPLRFVGNPLGEVQEHVVIDDRVEREVGVGGRILDDRRHVVGGESGIHQGLYLLPDGRFGGSEETGRQAFAQDHIMDHRQRLALAAEEILRENGEEGAVGVERIEVDVGDFFRSAFLLGDHDQGRGLDGG